VKVGKYDIPNIRLHPTLFEATKTLYEKFTSEEAPDQLTVANLLGHKTDKSGAFISKLADLRAYGLITSRGLKVTDLGKKLTYDPSDEERNNALKEALLNIPLWKELHSRFSKTLPTSDFWVELTKITGLEAPDAKRLEENVRNAYLADFQYLKEEKKSEKGGKGMDEQDKFDTSGAKPSTLEELKFGDNVRIWLPKENIQEAWKKAKKMIDIYLGVEKHKEEG
jgi:hypothetical protein